jgi:Zn-dependent metalloprotease
MAKGMRSTAIHRDELGGAAIADAGPTSARALKEMDPEHAARRILSALMEGSGRAAVAVPAASGAPAEFKSLGVEKVPFTGTQMVKFRQQFHKIPVYGSLVTVELDDSNGFVAVNSSLGEPSGVDAVATLSPAQAIQAIKEWAGYGDQELVEPTRLNFYFDQKAERWRLVYIVEDVLRHTPRRPQQQDSLTALPEYSDFVLDAHTGERVAELPRTQTMAQTDAQQSAADTLGVTRDFQVLTDSVANASSLHDRQRNVHTHDFGFRDTVLQRSELPGPYVGNPPNPWEPGAVSAHAKRRRSREFLEAGSAQGRAGRERRQGHFIGKLPALR